MRVSDPRIEHAYVQMGMARIEIDMCTLRAVSHDKSTILIDVIRIALVLLLYHSRAMSEFILFSLLS